MKVAVLVSGIIGDNTLVANNMNRMKQSIPGADFYYAGWATLARVIKRE